MSSVDTIFHHDDNLIKTAIIRDVLNVCCLRVMCVYFPDLCPRLRVDMIELRIKQSENSPHYTMNKLVSSYDYMFCNMHTLHSFRCIIN